MDAIDQFVSAFNKRDLAALKALFAPDATAQVMGSPFPEERGSDDIEKKSLTHMLGEQDAPLKAEAARLDSRALVLFRDAGKALDTVGVVTESGGKIQRIEYLTTWHQADELMSIELALRARK